MINMCIKKFVKENPALAAGIVLPVVLVVEFVPVVPVVEFVPV